MEKLLQVLSERTIEFVLMFVVIIFGFFIYLTSTNEPMRSRVRGGVQGSLISAVSAYPIWSYIGRENLAALVIITIILCVSGQFLIEPLQKSIPKYLTRLLDRIEVIIDRILGGGGGGKQ